MSFLKREEVVESVIPNGRYMNRPGLLRVALKPTGCAGVGIKRAASNRSTTAVRVEKRGLLCKRVWCGMDRIGIQAKPSLRKLGVKSKE